MVEDGVLKKMLRDKKVIVLPTTMQTEGIRRVHEIGHFGVRKMEENLKQDYYIPKLREKLEKFVSCCIPCVLAEKKLGKKEGELIPIPKGDAPLDTFHIDHLGPMTVTGKLYKHVFAVVDGFTKFVWIDPTKTVGTVEVLGRLINQQKTFGNPGRIVSDRGATFRSDEFRDYCAAEGIKHSLITAGVPRGNGQIERSIESSYLF